MTSSSPQHGGEGEGAVPHRGNVIRPNREKEAHIQDKCFPSIAKE